MKNGALIRRAVPSDAERISVLAQMIQRLHAQAMPEVFKPATAHTFSTTAVHRVLGQPASILLVAANAADVVGYLYADVQHRPESAIKYAASRILVHQLVVDTAWHRRGIGGRLLQHLRRIAEAQQIPTLALDVWDFNKPAHDFYRANGFRDTRHALSASLPAIEVRRSEV